MNEALYSKITFFELIETLWNVNYYVPDTIVKRIVSELIETLWNVNKTILRNILG